MASIKRVAVLGMRPMGACLAMVIAYMVGTLVVGDTGSTLTPEEANQTGVALIVVAIIQALALSHLILRSRWRGLALIGAVFLIHVGLVPRRSTSARTA